MSNASGEEFVTKEEFYERMAEVHKGRWRALSAWVIVFSVIVFWVLYAQDANQKKTTDRFCEVASAFIGSNLVLRSSEDSANVKAIGLRRELIHTDKRLLATFKAFQSTTKQGAAFRLLLIEYIQDGINLDQDLIVNSQDVLTAADKATAKWTHLQKGLKC